MPVLHGAVDGDGLAWPDAQQVADLDLVEVDVGFGPVRGDPVGGLRG